MFLYLICIAYMGQRGIFQKKGGWSFKARRKEDPLLLPQNQTRKRKEIVIQIEGWYQGLVLRTQPPYPITTNPQHDNHLWKCRKEEEAYQKQHLKKREREARTSWLNPSQSWPRGSESPPPKRLLVSPAFNPDLCQLLNHWHLEEGWGKGIGFQSLILENGGMYLPMTSTWRTVTTRSTRSHLSNHSSDCWSMTM